MGFPGGSVVKNPPVNAGDTGLIPGSTRVPGEKNVNPLQCSCLGNPMGRGAWATGSQRVRYSLVTEQQQQLVLCDNTEGCDWGQRRESQEGGTDVYTELIHIVVQQELTQHCKAIIPQLKKK